MGLGDFANLSDERKTVEDRTLCLSKAFLIHNVGGEWGHEGGSSCCRDGDRTIHYVGDSRLMMADKDGTQHALWSDLSKLSKEEVVKALWLNSWKEWWKKVKVEREELSTKGVCALKHYSFIKYIFLKENIYWHENKIVHTDFRVRSLCCCCDTSPLLTTLSAKLAK